MTENQRDVMEYEVAIVGGGPAGLACAIRLKQLKPDLTVSAPIRCPARSSSPVPSMSFSPPGANMLPPSASPRLGMNSFS
jgi:2-polyprenyl-6-methoxyphenol hydroxylase-like FAD-dependent oxidoreductase